MTIMMYLMRYVHKKGKKKTISCDMMYLMRYIHKKGTLKDLNYATLSSPYIFQKTLECKLPLLR